VLTVTALSLSLPVKVYAETDIKPLDGPQVEDIIAAKESVAKIVGELEGKRERYSKHFFKEDATFEAAVYPYPVHYYENKEWKEVDNTLEEAQDETFVEEPAGQVVENGVEQTGEQTTEQQEQAPEVEQPQETEQTQQTERTEVINEDDKTEQTEETQGQDEVQPEVQPAAEAGNNQNAEAEVDMLSASAAKVTDSKNVLKNKQNDYKVTFSKNAKSNKLVSIDKDNYRLSWNID
jgi:hypothetical protein